jgi:hypothetical protein
MGDGIIIFVFCQESLVVMGLMVALKEIQENVELFEKVVWL